MVPRGSPIQALTTPDRELASCAFRPQPGVEKKSDSVHIYRPHQLKPFPRSCSRRCAGHLTGDYSRSRWGIKTGTEKFLLSLTILCIALGLCHGECYTKQHKAQIVDDQIVLPDGCTDLSDGGKHAFGTVWNSAKCFRCSCDEGGMHCCTRYGVVHYPGCKGVINPETCEYDFYRIDNPSERCP
ncbi:small serum protein 5-like [Rhineura floridana]|uniref:small serum protein 5-like n=1 Tax=Rhineura floridana TaxID=261503 RepID=UPI002AC83F0E|nr:small serum protein 5-like [Rhineura floridana]